VFGVSFAELVVIAIVLIVVLIGLSLAVRLGRGR
jgi:hypothetical protein